MSNCDLVSDLHLDFYTDAEAKLEAIVPTSQTLVIAGDLCEARNWNPNWADILSNKYERILYVLGNHEWYGLSFKTELGGKIMKRWLPNNWTLLDNEVSGDFKGTTLWFANDPQIAMHERGWSDFKWIKHLKPGVYEAHEAAKQFLFDGVYCPVWITHHLPFWQSVHPKYIGASSNLFFVGNIAREMWHCQEPPKVILHGHTHELFDYELNGIRVVANPFGYPNEGRSKINPKFVEW